MRPLPTLHAHPLHVPASWLPIQRLSTQLQSTGSLDEVTAEDVEGGEVDEVVQNLALRITEVGARMVGRGGLSGWCGELVPSCQRRPGCCG
jgi:hypothetical protein